MAIRDKLRLGQTVPQLKTSVHCFICKYDFVEPDLAVLSPCCGRRFHQLPFGPSELSILHKTGGGGGGLPAVCNKQTSEKGDRELPQATTKHK